MVIELKTTGTAGDSMHAYSHPNAKYPLTPGTVVKHLQRPGVPLIIVSGPEKGIRGEIYRVRTPEGETVRVLLENLRV